MLPQFNFDVGQRRPTNIMGGEFALTTITRNVNKVKDHFLTYQYATDLDHILVKLLTLFTGYDDTAVGTYFAANNQQRTLIKALGIISDVSGYRLLPKQYFFSDDVKEILISFNMDFDPTNITRTWKTLSPVKCLVYPEAGIHYGLLEEEEVTGKYGVIGIDVPMLIMQYWAYRKDMAEEDMSRGAPHFVMRHVLPNLLDSKIQSSMLNMVIAKLHKKETLPSVNPHTMALLTIDRKLSNYLDGLIERHLLGNGNFLNTNEEMRLYNDMPLNYPLIEASNTVTRYNEFAVVLAALPMLECLLLVDKLSDSRANTEYINDFKRLKRRWSSNAMYSTIPSGMDKLVKEAVTSRFFDYL